MNPKMQTVELVWPWKNPIDGKQHAQGALLDLPGAVARQLMSAGLARTPVETPAAPEETHAPAASVLPPNPGAPASTPAAVPAAGDSGASAAPAKKKGA